MTLTGVPLILLTASATAAAGAAVGWVWPRGGRLQPFTRVAGVLVVEALVVLTAGLVVNRHEQFYPSWQALQGDTGTATVADRRHAGLLDDRVRSDRLTWRPQGLAAWRLARPPTVTLPPDYRERPGVAFPVVLAFAGPGGPGAPPRRTPEAVTVTIAPTAGTTAAALSSLPDRLSHDLRVTTAGWDVVGRQPLAAAFVTGQPAGAAVLDQPVTALPPALTAPLRLPPAGTPS
ncbi:hypothetical protein [Actinoplanes sp. M2I2]|uniref:hypothetical protein n=1 Tax=Actinoplanes sp. M2I2 TaxID=1734444 RepID=UPI0020213005|nr:hypothetical protein [Actinoplanes sp. M2I2]